MATATLMERKWEPKSSSGPATNVHFHADPIRGHEDAMLANGANESPIQGTPPQPNGFSPAVNRHRCFLCNRTYERQDHLNRHLKSHDNERSYRCPDCGKGFNRADLLNRHRAAHTKTASESLRRRTGKACEACIKAKTKCDDDRPCKRCKTRGVACQETEARRTSQVENWSHLPPSPAMTSSQQMVVSTGQQPPPFSASPPIEHAALLLGLNGNNVPATGMAAPYGNMTAAYDPESAALDNYAFPDFFEQIMMPSTYPIAQQAMAMPPDVSNLTQDLTFDACDFDFSFLASGLTRPPTAQGYHAQERDEVSDGVTPLSDAQLRSEAFKKSPWSWNHWIPERNTHAFTGQSEINIEGDRVHAKDQFTSPGSIPLASIELDHAARDRMIRVVTQIAHNRLAVPSFPSLELLEDLVDVCLMQDSSAIDTYFHAASFTCQTATTEQLLGMVARGARYIALPPVWKMGLVIQEVVRLAVAEAFERDNSATRDLRTLQAYICWLDVGVWSGFRRQTEIAVSFLQPVATMLSWSDRLKRVPNRGRDVVPTWDDSDDVLNEKWLAWAEQESYKRLVIHAFVHDSQVALVNMRNPLITPAHLLLPPPAPRELWLAPNAHAWRNVSLKHMAAASDGAKELISTISLMETFGDTALVEQLGGMVDQPLCLLTACHTLSHSVWHYRQKTKLVSKFHTGERRDRWLSHLNWQRGVYDDLVALHTYCDVRRASLEIILTLEFLMMSLYVSLEDVQTFSGKSGEEEARKVFPGIRAWTQDAQSRQAVWHAGQVLRLARSFEKTKLRDFYAVALYHSTLTLWVYGMVTSNTARKSVVQSPTARPSTPHHRTNNDFRDRSFSSPPLTLVDGDDEKTVKAFTLLGQGTPGIQCSSTSAYIPLSNSKGLMATAEAMLKANFPHSRNGLPPLVENLTSLMNELGRFSG